MKNVKIILTIVTCLMSSIATGDVIHLKDGTIYLGEIKNVDSTGILIQSFGSTQSISQSDILKTDKELTEVSKRKIEVELKDASMLKGRIDNYDDEIGLFVMTDFGTITIASGAIKSISDIEFRNKVMGYDKGVGLQLGMALPTGSQKANFNTGYIIQGYFEHTSIFVRDLFIGLDLKYNMFENANSSDITYDIVSVQPYLSYMFRYFRKTTVPVLNDIIPFVSAGGGLTFVTMHDDRTGGGDSAELVPSYFIGAGIDYLLFSPVTIRLKVLNEWIMESSGSFSTIQISFGAMMGF